MKILVTGASSLSERREDE